MAVEVVLPMLGVTVENGVITEWLKKEGDAVTKGEAIYAVEADKVVTEVESPATGILGKILIGVDHEVPVLTVVGIIVNEGEEVPAKYLQAAAPAAPEAAAPAAQPEVDATSSASPQAEEDNASYDYDIAVIGGGPGGYVAAIRGAQMKAKVLLVEKEHLGGTCCHTGCIPTKAYLSDVKPLYQIKRSGVYTGAENLGADFAKMVERKDKVVATMAGGVQALLKAKGVTYKAATAYPEDAHTVRLENGGASERVTAKKLILATGSRPADLPFAPVDGERILNSDQIFSITTAPKSLIIIGGGVIGVEFACIFANLGCEVTVVEMLDRLVATEDKKASAGLRKSLLEQGVTVHTGAKVLSVKTLKKSVKVAVDLGGSETTLDAETLLVATGRKPVTDAISGLGLAMDGPFVKVDSRLETSLTGVYAIGDLIGGMMLAHAASEEGVIAVENALGGNRRHDSALVPACIYTFPEVASVGLSKKEAKEQGYQVKEGQFFYRANGKAQTMGESEGFVKIVADAELGEILGVHIFGEHATDLIAQPLLGMHTEAVVEDLADVIAAHPTLSEMIKEAALDVRGEAIHKP